LSSFSAMNPPQTELNSPTQTKHPSGMPASDRLSLVNPREEPEDDMGQTSGAQSANPPQK
jgi:hypothetical protein